MSATTATPTQAALSRRELMLAMAASGLAVPALGIARARGEVGPLYVSCRGDAQRRFFASGFAESGRVGFDIPLPGRGHGVAVHPILPHCVVFARRPGTFAVVIDMASGTPVARFDSAEGRHFYGHGVFTPDGHWLLTTENDYDGGRGTIGVRDATEGYAQVSEFPSDGIGPHEVVLMADGKTLVIANGGLLTAPDTGREDLNVDSMEPSLAYVDVASGKCLANYRLPETLHQLSIRHIAVSRAGTVAIAMQYEGPKNDAVPLIAVHDGGDAIETVTLPEDVRLGLRQYTGSVCFDSAEREIAVSSPRGGTVLFVDVASRSLRAQYALPDGCGVAPGERPSDYVLTSGSGRIVEVAAGSETRQIEPAPLATPAWDNHVRGPLRVCATR